MANHCVHRHYLNNNVHKFIFEKADEQAVDEFCQVFEQLMRDHEGTDPILMMVDLRPDGIPPFQYLLRAIRDIYSRVDNPPEFRSAYMYNRSMFLAIMRRFFSMLNLNNQRQFFENPNEPDVLKWVLEGQQPQFATDL